MRWTPDREVPVRALAGSLCCVLGQDTLLSKCLFPPRSIHYWVPANCQGKLTKCWGGGGGGGGTCDVLASHPGGVAILLVASCYGNRDKLRLCGPLGSCADGLYILRNLALIFLELSFTLCNITKTRFVWHMFCILFSNIQGGT